MPSHKDIGPPGEGGGDATPDAAGHTTNKINGDQTVELHRSAYVRRLPQEAHADLGLIDTDQAGS